MMRAAPLGAAAAAVTFALIAAVAGIDGGDREVAGERAAIRDRAPTDGEIAAGRLLFARMGCGGCHTLAAAGSRGQIGPELDGLLTRHDRETLIAVITDPPSGSGGLMPADFGDRMTRDELDDLASFLLAARGGGGRGAGG